MSIPGEQKWPVKSGLVRYRVAVRNALTGIMIGVLRDLSEPCCVLPEEWLSDLDHTAMRVEIADLLPDGTTGDWATWVPYFLLGSPTEADVWLDSPVSDGFPTRLIIRNAQGNRILSDQTRREGRFPLETGLAPHGARLSYTFMRYHHAASNWIDIAAPTIFQYGAQVPTDYTEISSVTQPDGCASEPGDRDTRLFFFTVDVEINMRYQRIPDSDSSVDEHVFGVTPAGGEKEYGIRYIMDALDARKMKGTFFVDVLMEYQVGEMGLRRTLDALLERGHDVQLHLHPNPNLYFAADKTIRQIGIAYAKTRKRDTFREALELAIRLFERRCGYMPVAFRNGSYVLKDEYFEVLKEFGICFDSSLYAFKNNETAPWIRARTSPFLHNSGIIEIPVTWAVRRSQQGTVTFQHSVGIGRQAEQVDESMRAFWGLVHEPLVTVIHSYSLLRIHRNRPDAERLAWNQQLKSMVAKEQYRMLYLDGKLEQKMTLDGPDPLRLTALDARLDMIARDPRVRAITFADLPQIPPSQLIRDSVIDPIIEHDNSSASNRLTGLQRYNVSYLEHLDAQGACGS